MVAVHGRTYKQSHSGEVNRDFISRVKQALGEKCLVLGNGGIKSYEQAISHQQEVDGVMIGQSAIGWPWIFTDHEPTHAERKDLALKHLRLVIACELYLKKHQDFESVFRMPMREELDHIAQHLDTSTEENLRSPIEFRKYLFNYVTGLVGNKEFKQRVAQMKDWRAIEEEIEGFLG
jgi:tRNA-dihydrouridine synthase